MSARASTLRLASVLGLTALAVAVLPGGAASAPMPSSEPALDCEQVPLLRDACDRDRNAAACFQYALCLHEGEWVARSDLAAVDNLARACDLGLGAACAELAGWRESGWPPPADLGASLAAHARACDLGVARSCVQAGLFLELGLAGPVDLPRAAAMYSSAFARGDRDATRQLARLHRDGKATYSGPAGVAWELRLQESACDDADPEACTAFADGLATGRGARRDPMRALALAQSTCAAGHGPACTLAGGLLVAAREPRAARLALQRACALEDVDGCARLGELLVTCPGPTCERSRGASLIVDACRVGHDGACARVILERERALDPSELARACRGPLRASELCAAWCAIDPARCARPRPR